MENKPKKSKAFIITFIVVLLLLLLGYFLFVNSEKIFGTKGETTINKIFSPLLGTSKKATLETLDTTTKETCSNNATNPPSCTMGVDGACLNSGGNPPSCTTSTDGSCLNGANNPPDCTTMTERSVGQEGSSGQAGFGSGGNLANNGMLNSIPIPDMNFGDLPNTSDQVTNTTLDTKTQPEIGGGTNEPTADTSLCSGQAPLTLTPEEELAIKDLLRRYYLLAQNIKTKNDINAIGNDISNTDETINKAKTLTTQCYTQKADPAYTGENDNPIVKGNPYYNKKVFYEPLGKYINELLNVAVSQCTFNLFGIACIDHSDPSILKRSDGLISLSRAINDYVIKNIGDQNAYIHGFLNMESFFNIW